jgi:flagellar protein FlbD
MIHVTRINQHKPFVLNSDHIDLIEATPDTVITMMNGQKLVVAESAEVVVEKVVAFRRSIQMIPVESASAGSFQMRPLVEK